MGQDDAYRGSVESRFLAACDAPLYNLHKKPFVLAEDFPNYGAGSEGPKEANALIKADGRAWRRI